VCFDLFLQRVPRLAIGCDDQNRVVPRNGAGDFSGNFAASTAAASGWAPLGGVFSTQKIFRGANNPAENSRSARVRGATLVDSSGKAEPVL